MQMCALHSCIAHGSAAEQKQVCELARSSAHVACDMFLRRYLPAWRRCPAWQAWWLSRFGTRPDKHSTLLSTSSCVSRSGVLKVTQCCMCVCACVCVCGVMTTRGQVL
eukprot:1143734-Pelagomonas_calceolata.AAC.2